jgi:hypothetical protein
MDLTEVKKIKKNVARGELRVAERAQSKQNQRDTVLFHMNGFWPVNLIFSRYPLPATKFKRPYAKILVDEV